MTGCGSEAPEQVEEPQDPTAHQEEARPIAGKDFESGETEHLVGANADDEKDDESGEARKAA